MRKTLIAVAAAFVVAVAFWGYLAFTGSDSVALGPISEVNDLPIQPVNIMPEQIGEPVIKVVVQTRYVILDPQTKELSRVLGFETLLNPGENSRWEVKKPYIEFYESGYQCRIDADKGFFTVNAAGRDAVPSDAQLEENVIIHVEPRPGSAMSETYIYLDDLVFSSERSEFSTDGPVRMVSDKVLLEGQGMVLIFNTGTGRLDYLNIRKLQQLVLKDVVEPASASEQTVESGASAAVSAEGTPGEKQDDSKGATERVAAQRSQPGRDYYQCVLQNNVLIRYGQQLVVAGADNVSVKNILLKSSESQAAEPAANARKVQPAPAAADSTSVSSPDKQPAVANTSPLPKTSAEDSNRDVTVTCDGGIIFQPMDDSSGKTEKSPSALKLEMTGDPLQVKHAAGGLPAQNEQTLIKCGKLEYEPEKNILRLETHNDQRQITLHSQPSNNRIETQGNVAWNRRSGWATIGGPGKIYLSPKAPAREPSEVAFQGAMNLFFDPLKDNSSGSGIERINLIGGVDAILKEDGWYKTSAESARLQFGPDSMMQQILLNGGVRFESLKGDNPQRASSQSAAFKFGPQNQITTAQMTGDVRFESGPKNNASQAAAQKAVLHFDNSKIRKADLQGEVSFVSESGKIMAADATIDFVAGAGGAVQPGKVHTAGNAVLLAAVSSADEPPAKFEAGKIDYDLQSRSGLAHGPVRFTFYQKAEAASSSIEPWIPVVITASENTQFISNKAGAMEQVIFNKDVLATRLFKSFSYTQQDQFHGDKLTILLSPAEDGRRGIGEIRMTDGNVSAESVRNRDEVKLSHIKLACREISWNRLSNAIAATGPGHMELDNSRANETPASSEVKSLGQKPAYARVEGFDKLHWDIAAQTLTADGSKETLQLAYVPLTDGQPEKFLYANSIRFEMVFTKDVNGKIILKRAFTNQPITFRELNGEQSKTLNEVVGQSLDYNPLDGGWLKIAGTPAMPVFLNGVRFPSVFVNVETGRIETSLSAVPSVYTK